MFVPLVLRKLVNEVYHIAVIMVPVPSADLGELALLIGAQRIVARVTVEHQVLPVRVKELLPPLADGHPVLGNLRVVWLEAVVGSA